MHGSICLPHRNNIRKMPVGTSSSGNHLYPEGGSHVKYCHGMKVVPRKTQQEAAVSPSSTALATIPTTATSNVHSFRWYHDSGCVTFVLFCMASCALYRMHGSIMDHALVNPGMYLNSSADLTKYPAEKLQMVASTRSYRAMLSAHAAAVLPRDMQHECEKMEADRNARLRELNNKRMSPEERVKRLNKEFPGIPLCNAKSAATMDADKEAFANQFQLAVRHMLFSFEGWVEAVCIMAIYGLLYCKEPLHLLLFALSGAAIVILFRLQSGDIPVATVLWARTNPLQLLFGLVTNVEKKNRNVSAVIILWNVFSWSVHALMYTKYLHEDKVKQHFESLPALWDYVKYTGSFEGLLSFFCALFTKHYLPESVREYFHDACTFAGSMWIFVWWCSRGILQEWIDQETSTEWIVPEKLVNYLVICVRFMLSLLFSYRFWNFFAMGSSVSSAHKRVRKPELVGCMDLVPMLAVILFYWDFSMFMHKAECVLWGSYVMGSLQD